MRALALVTVYKRQLFPIGSSDNCLLEETLLNGFQWQLSMRGNSSQCFPGDNCLHKATVPNGFRCQQSTGENSSQWVPVTTVHKRQLFLMGFGANYLREETLTNGFQWQLSMRCNSSQWLQVTTVHTRQPFLMGFVTIIYGMKLFPMGTGDNCVREETLPNGF